MQLDDEYRFEVQAQEWRDISNLTLHCTRCNAWTAILKNLATLAELVQRAGEHTEVCR